MDDGQEPVVLDGGEDTTAEWQSRTHTVPWLLTPD